MIEKQKITKKISLALLSTFYLLLYTSRVKAMCPICTIAVGSAVVLLEKYGVDNTISGLWIGGLMVSTSIMTINWLRKINLSDLFTDMLIFILFYASLILAFHHKGIIGNPTKTIWGMDKVLFSIGIGSISFYLAGMWYQKIKDRNKGHAWFPFQRVIWPVLPLIVLSLIFYYLTK